jgi:hypothetical protein
MICKHCHDYIPEDSRFCPKCGVRIWIDVAPDPPWLWICTIMLFALTWSVMFRKELKVKILDLRAQVQSALSTL